MRKIPAQLRTTIVLLFDLFAAVAAWYGAFFLRFNLDFVYAFEYSLLDFWWLLSGLLGVQLVACRVAGLHRGMWTFASLPDLRRVLLVAFIAAAVLFVVALTHTSALILPRSVVVLYPILLFMFMAGGRVSWRMLREYQLCRHSGRGRPVVVVGAGTAGMMLVRELDRSNEWNIVALVDDDPHKMGLELLGRRVEGAVRDLPTLLEKYEAEHVILAMPSARAQTLQRASDIAHEAGASLFTVPGLQELMAGRVAINSMRPVQIEDLLGRAPVEINNDDVAAMLKGKRLLVTGAGGSIGAELCRQLARFAPSCIVLVEVSEYALYQIDGWLKEHYPDLPIVPLTGDVKDSNRMDEGFAQYEPQVVFHAAAYKHVPLMEVGNAWQAVRNNVVGTWVVANAAIAHGAERFVLISTDKAVNPTNVMGTTKRMAEMVCQALQTRAQSAAPAAGQGLTRFQMVRFGNVLGSTGSVIPRFEQQIAQGGPVTVTHPDVTRYFMSIPEAALLVLQAAAMGTGGEIFVLDMGEPVKIDTLAKNLIQLAGHSLDDIEIIYTGLRPGEKMFEELLVDEEQTIETPHAKLRIARARTAPKGLLDTVREWALADEGREDEDVRRLLKEWVKEYEPNPEGYCTTEGAEQGDAKGRAKGMAENMAGDISEDTAGGVATPPPPGLAASDGRSAGSAAQTK